MSDGAAAIATKEIGKRKRKTDSKKNNEEKKPVSGTTNFFKNENIGRKGLGKKLKKYAHAPSINVTTSEMSTYLADTVPQAPISSRLNEMMHIATTRRMLPNIWFSLERNIIFYGFGGKKKLIDGIVANFLKGEDVLAIDGNNGVSSVKALLSTISKSVLGSEDHAALGLILNAKHIVDQLDRHYGVSSRNEAAGEVSGKRISRDSTGPAVQRGQYKHSRPRLFIIVHDIGALQHRESQWALSILGACASVCIIATLENLNTSLLWDAEMLVRFNWIYRHMPTYQHYPMSSEFAFSKSNHYTSDENGVSGLLPTLSSLTNKHREMFEVFCENVLPLENRRMLRSDLLAVLKQKMTAKDSEELRQLLKEFLDHDIIQEMSIAKRDYLGVQLPDRELRNFLQKKAEGYFR